MQSQSFLDQLVSSPACAPKASFADLLPSYRQLGFTKFEGFSEWAEARLNWREDPAVARGLANKSGMAITSFHLPLIKADAVEEGLQNALSAARYAQALGAKVVLLKAETRELFRTIGKRFLDSLDQQEIKVTPVVQNHKGTAITTIDDYREVFAAVDHDPRLKALLEVGHFYRIGVNWKTGWEFLGERIALIHINDISDGKSVLYGTGDVDFAGLVRQIKTTGYAGEIVVELELATRDTDTAATFDGLRKAIDHLLQLHSKA